MRLLLGRCLHGTSYASDGMYTAAHGAALTWPFRSWKGADVTEKLELSFVSPLLLLLSCSLPKARYSNLSATHLAFVVHGCQPVCHVSMGVFQPSPCTSVSRLPLPLRAGPEFH